MLWNRSTKHVTIWKQGLQCAADVLGRGLGGSSSAAGVGAGGINRAGAAVALIRLLPLTRTLHNLCPGMPPQLASGLATPTPRLGSSSSCVPRQCNTQAQTHPTAAACACRCPHLHSRAAETRPPAQLRWPPPAAAVQRGGRSTPPLHGSRPPTCAAGRAAWQHWMSMQH